MAVDSITGAYAEVVIAEVNEQLVMLDAVGMAVGDQFKLDREGQPALFAEVTEIIEHNGRPAAVLKQLDGEVALATLNMNRAQKRAYFKRRKREHKKHRAK